MLNWFALRVRPRCEKAVACALRDKGYEELLPLHQERRRWSDRIVTAETPLFAGYVFCRFDVQQRLPILKTPGVLLVVGFGRTPQPIDDEEIESLRILAASHLQLQPWPYLQFGGRVQIIGGPLAGAEGVVLSAKTRHRLVVSVTLLQRSVAVDIPECCVWPLGPGVASAVEGQRAAGPLCGPDRGHAGVTSTAACMRRSSASANGLSC